MDLSSAGLTSAGTWSVALYNGWSTGPSVTYDASFTLNDVCAIQNGTPGCTLLEACNYDSEATVDDGSCILP